MERHLPVAMPMVAQLTVFFSFKPRHDKTRPDKTQARNVIAKRVNSSFNKKTCSNKNKMVFKIHQEL